MKQYKCKICRKEFEDYECQHRMFCSKQCKGKARKGHYKTSEETKRKQSESMKKVWSGGKMKGMTGKTAWCKGLKLGPLTIEHKKKIQIRLKKFYFNRPPNKHHSWKCGKITSVKGYIKIHQSNHPHCDCRGYVSEHRLIMEKHLGRLLCPKEEVHHIDWDKSNNGLSNLYLFSSHKEHVLYHKHLRDCVKDSLLYK